tara:strand:- start:619 stop:1284 length:666 start_codon:yes stop_codon:yes gene_type:complete
MNEKLKKVLVTLGLETAEVKTENVVKLAEQILDNGTVVVSEEFKEGSPIFIKSADSEESEDVALPIGEYTLENGDVLVVEVEGEILSITTPEAEPKEEEAPKEEEVVEAEEEKKDEPTEDDSEEPKEEVQEDDHAAKMADMESRLAKLEEMLAPAEEIIEEEVKEELTKETKETKEEATELSEEVVFSPEAKTPSNNNGTFKFPKNNTNSALSRVYGRLNN